MTDDRRSGRTTRQMLEAPKGAYYVWPHKATSYAKQLAEHLGRKDLTIVHPAFFGYKGRGKGMRVKIVIDHECVLTVTQMAAIDRSRKE